MTFILTEEERLLRNTAMSFITQECPLSSFRSVRYQNSFTGFSPKIWGEMVALGWAGIPFPDEFGGLDMGLAPLAQIMEQCGRQLVPTPIISTVILSGQLLLSHGSDSLKKQYLPRIISGSSIFSLAFQEDKSRHNPLYTETRVEKLNNAYILNGCKTLVLDAPACDAFIISARHENGPDSREGISLFFVPKDHPGLECQPQTLMDGRMAGRLLLNNVTLDTSQLLGEEGKAAPLLERVIDLATAALCSEMLGGMQAAFELAMEYLKQREQFGVKIGSFQALQHRASRLYIDIQLADSAVRAANYALDNNQSDALEIQKLVSLAKALCSDSYLQITCDALQIFGGIGMTDEHDIGLYLKRARVSEQLFGDAAWHRSRWASLSGY